MDCKRGLELVGHGRRRRSDRAHGCTRARATMTTVYCCSTPTTIIITTYRMVQCSTTVLEHHMLRLAQQDHIGIIVDFDKLQ